MNAMMACNPVLSTVFRGSEVESLHRGSAVVLDVHGHMVLAVGNVKRKIFPRSAYKFLQAIPLVESGAADAFGLGPDKIALACASHNAEPRHVQKVEQWLLQLGLADHDLECGPARPLDRVSADLLVKTGTTPGCRHHACSGKHAGMLTLARHLGEATSGYSDYEHPTQQAWRTVMHELMQVDADNLAWDRDGCGLPALCMPMEGLAYGFARYSICDGGTPSRSASMTRILDAVRQHPEMVAGSARCCTAVIRQTRGRILVKTGAEGVFCGSVPERGLGFVLKIDDGAKRASEVALGGLLAALELLDDEETRALKPWFRPDIINSQGRITGRIEPGCGWSG